jgi:hypothetical protein
MLVRFPLLPERREYPTPVENHEEEIIFVQEFIRRPFPERVKKGH